MVQLFVLKKRMVHLEELAESRDVGIVFSPTYCILLFATDLRNLVMTHY
jgi:hypothetical protein